MIKIDALKLEIYDRLQWFIKLRWAAIGGITLTVLFFKWIFDFNLFSTTLALLLAAMVLCNITFTRLNILLHKKYSGDEKKFFTPTKFANLQIGLDLLFLAFLWHFYGGVENPLMFFFVFHMIIASILLSRLNSLLWAFLSSAALAAIALLEYTGRFYHHPLLSNLTGIKLYDNLYYVFFTLSAFCFSLLCVVLMTTSISARLRKRNLDIIDLEKKVSERKLQATEKQLFFSEKMAALGKLAAGIAHEINNPLTTVLSYSECLADELQDRKPLLDDVNIIIGETIRIREIVKDILNFARASEHSEPSDVDINKEISETIKMLRHQMNFINIMFDLRLDHRLPLIKIGKEHLKQVVINILVNASQAMQGKGFVSIHTAYDEMEKAVVIRFKDSGPGIRPEYLNNIFDPYFTTKKQGEGTGLGLAVSYGLIKIYGGNIVAESEEGKGATFTLTFPLEPKEQKDEEEK